MNISLKSRPSPSFDIAVAGAGPAGAVAALCLARLGWKVALLDANLPGAPRDGETLPPECNPLLRGLGLGNALDRSRPLESPGLVSTWGQQVPVCQDFLFNPHGTGWHVDRLRFDTELCAEAARAGVTVLQGTRLTPGIRTAGWWQSDGVRARFLVDATGRKGLRFAGPAIRDIDDVLLALVLRLRHPGGGPSDLRTHIAAVRCGWWYWAPVPGGTSIAMFFTSRQEYLHRRTQRPADLAQESPAMADLLRSATVTGSRWVSVSSSLRRTLSGDGWIAIGDSASSYDPLSGRGIFKAIRHASLASRAVNACLRDGPDSISEYATRVRTEYRDYLNQRHFYYASERRWPDSPFWASRSSHPG